MKASLMLAIIALVAVASAQETQQEPPKTDRKLPYYKGWPKPVMDDLKFSYFEFENLEVFRESKAWSLSWDAFGWQGTDKRRTWLRTSGETPLSGGFGRFDAQVLDGRLISPLIDFVYGLRYEAVTGSGNARGQGSAVVGLQGSLPYRFNVEASLFLPPDGNLSGRVSGSYQAQLTQRLYLVPRVEINAASRRSERMGIEPGINSAEFGLRLRYEIKREFAPYIGYVVTRGKRGALGGGNQSAWVLGLRVWF